MKTAIGHPEPNKDFIAFRECALWLASDRPRHIRLGQFLFNHLYEMYPVLANSVRGRVEVDPFYNDKYVDNFWVFVEYNWGLDDLKGNL